MEWNGMEENARKQKGREGKGREGNGRKWNELEGVDRGRRNKLSHTNMSSYVGGGMGREEGDFHASVCLSICLSAYVCFDVEE